MMCVFVQSEQVLQLSSFIEAELVYHQQSVDILQALLDSLKKKYNINYSAVVYAVSK